MIMMAIYSLIFMASAAFASWAGERIFTRVLREMAAPDTLSQLMVVLAAFGFLIVVAAPAGWIVGGLLVMGLGLWQPGAPHAPVEMPSLVGWSIASLLGVYGLTEFSGAWPAMLPAPAWWGLALVAWFVLFMPAHRVQPSQWIFSGAITLSAIPLILAPLLFPRVHGSLALDAGIVIAALLGGVLSPYASQPATAMLRMCMAYVLVGMMLVAAYYGAWPAAAASALIWGVSLMLMRRQPVFDAEVARG